MTQDLLPRNVEAERSVIGAMLIDADAIEYSLEHLTEDKFFLEEHRLIFQTIVDIYKNGHSVDYLIIKDELKRNDNLEKVGGFSYILGISEDVATASHIQSYVEIVKRTAIQRELIEIGDDIRKSAYEDRDDVKEILDELEGRVMSISESAEKRVFTPLSPLIDEAYREIEKIEEEKEPVTGLPTGFVDFDELTRGLQKQDMIIIAGRPSTGKTSLALDISRYIAVNKDKAVGIFSLEMSKMQVAMRILCSQAKVDSQSVRSGYVTDSDWNALKNAANELYDVPIYIDDTPGIGIFEMRSKARRLKSRYDIAILIVDYLQLMRGWGGRVDNRQHEVSQISQFLKSLAKELDIPVVALSQLSRRIETHGNRRPILSDLRESGALEQDADLVCFLYRPSSVSTDEDGFDNNPFVMAPTYVTELIIGKQRNGPIGTVRLVFRNKYASFENMERHIDLSEYEGGASGQDS